MAEIVSATAAGTAEEREECGNDGKAAEEKCRRGWVGLQRVGGPKRGVGGSTGADAELDISSGAQAGELRGIEEAQSIGGELTAGEGEGAGAASGRRRTARV